MRKFIIPALIAVALITPGAAAPGDELPCQLPAGMTGVCTSFNDIPDGTPFSKVPALVNDWDVRLGQVDYRTPGQPVAMDMCGNKPIVIEMVANPDDQVTVCNNHLMDNMFDTGNLGQITYRARQRVDMNPGYVTFTADLNTTARQTIHAVVSDSTVRYPARPSWGDAGDNHDSIQNGFMVTFNRDKTVDVDEIHAGTTDVNSRIAAGTVDCMDIDDRRCKVELNFTPTSLTVTVQGQVLPTVTFARAMAFTTGNLALVRQQYNPTKDCESGIAGGTDCPGFYDWTTDPAANATTRGSAAYPLNPNPRFPNPQSLYPGTIYMGYDTTHWDNFGFKSTNRQPIIATATSQATIWEVTSTAFGGSIVPVTVSHPQAGSGRLVFSANGIKPEVGTNYQVRVNGGPWLSLTNDVGYGWRTNVFDGVAVVAGTNLIEFRSLQPTRFCCPPGDGSGFTVHAVTLETTSPSPNPSPRPSPSPVPTPHSTPVPSHTNSPTPAYPRCRSQRQETAAAAITSSAWVVCP